MTACLVFQMRKVFWSRVSQPGHGGVNPSCVTSGRLHLTSLDLSFLICKVGILIVPTSEHGWEDFMS